MNYLGDCLPGKPVNVYFNTVAVAGGPITLVGGAAAVYRDNNTTETTTGVTLTVDFDARTGLHVITIDTANAFYLSGSDYMVVLTAGTADAVSLAGRVLARFSLRNRRV